MKTRILAALLALVLPALTGCGQVTVTVEAAPLAAEGGTAAHMEDPLPPSYDIYETFGLEYDEAEDALYFGGKRVRYFFDGVDTGTGGQISRVEHIDPLGTVDVRTVREAVDNGDGSVDPFGPLTGLETASQAEFDARDIDALLHPSMAATTGCSESGGGRRSALCGDLRGLPGLRRGVRGVPGGFRHRECLLPGGAGRCVCRRLPGGRILRIPLPGPGDLQCPDGL